MELKGTKHMIFFLGLEVHQMEQVKLCAIWSGRTKKKNIPVNNKLLMKTISDFYFLVKICKYNFLQYKFCKIQLY